MTSLIVLLTLAVPMTPPDPGTVTTSAVPPTCYSCDLLQAFRGHVADAASAPPQRPTAAAPLPRLMAAGVAGVPADDDLAPRTDDFQARDYLLARRLQWYADHELLQRSGTQLTPRGSAAALF